MTRTSKAPLQSHSSLFFRYDPPVLLIEVVLVRESRPGSALVQPGVAELVFPHFKKWYEGNEAAVSAFTCFFRAHF